MKGLLIKDFKLMRGQKNFFYMMLLIAVLMIAVSNDFAMAVGFLGYLGSFFALSTISYDEFNNGNPFLFSLPITRKMYAVEKYVFGIVSGGISCMAGAMIGTVATLVKSSGTIQDVWLAALMVLPTMMILLAVMLPIQMKFGGERGRIALIIMIGTLLVIGILIGKVVNAFNVELASVFNKLSSLNIGMVITLLIVVSAIFLTVSCKISMGIMEKKEL